MPIFQFGTNLPFNFAHFTDCPGHANPIFSRLSPPCVAARMVCPGVVSSFRSHLRPCTAVAIRCSCRIRDEFGASISAASFITCCTHLHSQHLSLASLSLRSLFTPSPPLRSTTTTPRRLSSPSTASPSGFGLRVQFVLNSIPW
ncbi:hypothetical protein RHMOL_Rhmol12G0127100 [Rhododendron molle]|uniref:Uncharacterized protein n=1 Tax=Rhododendron molle TaxID=49168 RepID=A0ACC0LIM6_RHOML|nr:hypothetical protein RHMOL_Rhmol12G0127100 [Rhododendron molle]